MRHPLVRFAATMLGGALLLWLGFRDEILGGALIDLRTATAELALAAIQLTGLDAVRFSTALHHPEGFAIEISRGCTGFVGTALLALGIVAYPTSSGCRLLGVATVLPVFLTANLARIAHLFHLGVAQSAYFHPAHEVWWQVVLILIALGSWVGWVAWADRSQGHALDYGADQLKLPAWQGP